MALILHLDGFAYAKQLIREGKIDYKSSWSSYEPSAEQQNKFIESTSLEDYGKWFLGINTEANESTKGRYEFPYGDFSKLYRNALIAIEHRAGQYAHREVEAAAKQLLLLIDKK
jgi:hypothetical protein